MNKTVVRTVFATLFVEAVIALIIVLWITGGRFEFGPILREADARRRASKISYLGGAITVEEGGKSVTSPGRAASEGSLFKWQDRLEHGSYKEWLALNYGNKETVTDWKSERWSHSEDMGWEKAYSIAKGDKATVPNWGWVNVKNPDPVKSGNNSFGYGDSCGIQRGGIITAVGIEGNRLLVRYSISGTQYGTPCPSGVIFFTSKETFSEMTAEYNKVYNAEKSEKKLVKRLLGK